MSFLFGLIIALAGLIIAERFYGVVWGNRKLRKLNRENVRLRSIIRKKDDLITKSLKEMEKLREKK